MEQTDKEAKSSADENLDDLLSSCANDFDRPLPKKPSSSNQQTASNNSSDAKTSSAASKDTDDASWSEEFEQFSEVMENFLENETELNEFKNLMGTLNQGGPITDENFAASFAETIKGLTEGAQNIPEPTPEELSNLFSGFGLGGDSSDPDGVPEFMPLMQNVMQKLMSKELLYPSLKEIVDKYPQWLSDHKSTLKNEDYENYCSQFQLMKEICDQFEDESDESESEESKKKSFETVLQMMQKIQACGNPPKELVCDINQGVPFDEHGNIQIPGMPQQCAIM